MSKLKLLFYVEHFRAATGGLESNAVRLCRALADRGYEVHVLADDGEPVPDVEVHTDGLANRVALEGRLLPDLCIDWGFYHPAHLHRLGGGTHRGFIGYSLDAYRGLGRLFKKLKYQSAKHLSLIAREQAILRNPQAQFLANSELTGRLAVEDGASSERVTVHHNGVDLKRFHPNLSAEFRDEMRQAWGLRGDDVVFLFIAHNLRLKNLDLMLKVFAGLPAEAKAKLVVVGKRPPKTTAPWLVYAGEIEDMESAYGAADALVHPTYFDSCANVILEAMASGLPVVVSDTCGVNEILTDGKDGRVLSVRGGRRAVVSTWQTELALLCTVADERKKRGKQARASAEKHGYDAYVSWFDDYLTKVHAIKEREAVGKK